MSVLCGNTQLLMVQNYKVGPVLMGTGAQVSMLVPGWILSNFDTSNV